MQFQLDGFNSSSSVQVRRLCIWKLFGMISISKNVALFRSFHVFDVIQSLFTEKDSFIASTIKIMALFLLKNEDWTFSSAPPLNSFSALCWSIRVGVPAPNCVVTSNVKEKVEAEEPHSFMQKRRRKRTSKLEQVDRSNDHNDDDENSDDESYDHSKCSDVWNQIPDSIVLVLLKFWPDLVAFIFPEISTSELRDVNESQVGHAVALLTVNRILVNKADLVSSNHGDLKLYQEIICSSSLKCNLVSAFDEDENENENEEDSSASSCLLQHLTSVCTHLAGGLCQKNTKNNADKNAELWVILGVIDTACIRSVSSVEENLEKLVISSDITRSLCSTVYGIFSHLNADVLSQFCIKPENRRNQDVPSLPAAVPTFVNMIPEVGKVLSGNLRPRVEVADIWFLSTKVLVTLLNSSDLSDADADTNIAEQLFSAGIFNHIINTLTLLYPKRTSGDTKATLSPNETSNERFVYDACLYLIMLGTSVMKFCAQSQQANAHFASEEFSKNLSEVLLNILLEESSTFLDTIEKTKAVVSSEIVDTDFVRNKSESIPVAEVILSAHTSLFLFQLCKKCSYLKERVLNKLPRKSWWLPTRILKGFLVLQGSTGVIFSDSLGTVVSTTKAMEAEDEFMSQTNGNSSKSDGTDSTQKEEPKSPSVMPGDVDWITAETPATTINTSAAASADTTKWTWDGSDFVWLGNHEDEFVDENSNLSMTTENSCAYSSTSIKINADENNCTTIEKMVIMKETDWMLRSSSPKRFGGSNRVNSMNVNDDGVDDL